MLWHWFADFPQTQLNFFHFWVNLSFNVSLWVSPFNVCSTLLTLALRHQLDARICTLFNMTRPYEHCCVHILWAVTVALVQYPHLTAFHTVRVRKRRRDVLEPHCQKSPLSSPLRTILLRGGVIETLKGRRFDVVLFAVGGQPGNRAPCSGFLDLDLFLACFFSSLLLLFFWIFIRLKPVFISCKYPEYRHTALSSFRPQSLIDLWQAFKDKNSIRFT